ncbi:hypothetical protein F4808DRAFT_142334 [Astrocystis sublimbata]|nr:hypothetical protein F4808DRAFT_142334 [Astrocystis sublimbata]
MLRRPPTTLTLTAEDIAAYEDRKDADRAAQQQALAQAQLQARSQPPRAQLRHHALPQPAAMDTTTSSAEGSIDEPMQDEDDDDDEHHVQRDEDETEEEEEEDDDDDDDDDDPFTTQRHIRSVATAGQARAVSPGAQRSDYIRQMRARGGGGGHARSQSHTHTQSHAHAHTGIPTAAASRTHRIMGTAAASALPAPTAQVHAHLQQTPVQNATQGGAPTTRSGAAGRGGGGGIGRQASEPPPAPTRVTRSRDERLGLVPPAGQRGVGDGTLGPAPAGPTTRRR